MANSNDTIKSLLGTGQGGQQAAPQLNSVALKNIASNSTHVVTGVSQINKALQTLITSWGG